MADVVAYTPVFECGLARLLAVRAALALKHLLVRTYNVQDREMVAAEVAELDVRLARAIAAVGRIDEELRGRAEYGDDRKHFTGTAELDRCDHRAG